MKGYEHSSLLFETRMNRIDVSFVCLENQIQNQEI